jgi:6-phosphogluconolactonase
VEHGVAPVVRIFPSPAAATDAAAAHLLARALEGVGARGQFSWVLAGGRTPEKLYQRLAHRYRRRFPWDRTEVFFGDERCVPPRSPESNYAMARASMLDQVPISRGRIHRMRGEVRPPSRAAHQYARELGPGLRTGGPSRTRFDLVLLGIGTDGHTASLFPQARTLNEVRRAVVSVPRSPQPPYVPRLTLTLPALASSREVNFLVTGAEKSAAIAAVFRSLPEGRPELPASLVRSDGPILWFLDRAAASDLPGTSRTER